MRPIARTSTRPKAPRVGRPAGAFTQNRRLAELKRALEAEPLGLTLDDLAAALGVTQRSVRRYLKEYDGHEKDPRLSMLEFVQTTPGGAYRWRIKASERGRSLQLRREQAYALLATRRALDVLAGSALFDYAEIAFGQIAKIAETPFKLKDQISGERRLEDRFFWLAPAATTYRGDDLDELFRAVADLRVLRFRPRARQPGAASDPRERAVLHPYAMIVHDGSVHVIGTRAGANAPEVIALDAMSELRASETEHFELPASFDVTAWVHGDLGVARPSRVRAIIEFEARVAEVVRAKKLHPQQKVGVAPDGRVRISLPYVAEDRLVAQILAWGDAARVIEPPDLAQRIASILERAAARYRS